MEQLEINIHPTDLKGKRMRGEKGKWGKERKKKTLINEEINDKIKKKNESRKVER
jgi:hypothetical protein